MPIANRQNPSGPYTSTSFNGGEEAKRDYDSFEDAGEAGDKDSHAAIYNSQSRLTQPHSQI